MTVVWVGLALEVAFCAYVLARLLDLDVDLVAWWRRMTFTGRHSRGWVREQAREIRRREEAALDRVWVTGLAEWAARARGDGLDRGRGRGIVLGSL